MDEVKNILDKATAIKVYARQSKNEDLQNLAAKIRVRAQHRLGQLLKQAVLNDGNDRNNRGSAGIPRLPPLEKMGITKVLSSKCQKLAGVSEDCIASAMANMANKNEEITIAAVSRAVLPHSTKTRVCGITEKNIEDTRCLSMAMERLRFCQEKVGLLVSLKNGKNGDRVRKVLITYQRALKDFSRFIKETLAIIGGSV